jgi:hypothetical protein
MTSVLLCVSIVTGASLHDPTRPYDYARPADDVKEIEVQSMPRWVLNATVVSPDRTFAVINDTAIKVGHFIEEAKVIDIQLNRVTLNYQGKIVELEMAEEQSIKPLIQVRGK